ncbi:MAG: hypothetical protein LBD06_06045 [Candidatus Accumulibacter sp.]|nr:hypothetical protein [Accumulibacter sp.]
MRRQKTDELAALSRRVGEEKPSDGFFPSPPARQRRKPICLLSSVFCPLKLPSVF